MYELIRAPTETPPRSCPNFLSTAGRKGQPSQPKSGAAEICLCMDLR